MAKAKHVSVDLCYHTECVNCFSKLIIFEDVRDGDKFTCPRCKQRHKVNDIGGPWREYDKPQNVEAENFGTFTNA